MQMNTAFLLVVLPQSAIGINVAEPNAVLRAIGARGARATVERLYSDDGQCDGSLRGIASGDSGWLKVAAVLKSSADGGAADQRELAVGEALEHNAANVLRIAASAFEVSAICGGLDVDDARYDSFERAVAAVERRSKRVRAVADTELARGCPVRC